MRHRILSVEVAAGLLKFFGVMHENQAGFEFLLLIAEAMSTEEQAEFERHVEMRRVGAFDRTDAGEVVNAPSARADQIDDLIEACLNAVVVFERTPGFEATGEGGEDQRIANGFVGVVERAIDEDAAPVFFGLVG